MSDAPDRVLLVDDEKTVLNVLSAGFKKAGMEVKTVTNAEDALLLLETEQFGAVVTDKNLPGKSGLDLLRSIGERNEHCARLVITGYVNTESVLEALRLGADDYLIKPFENITLVIERVKRAMKHRRVQQERAALAASLRQMQKTLRQSEAEVFQKGTELDLFENVVELRIEDATRELVARVDALEAQLEVEKERRSAVKRTLTELSGKTEGELAQRLLAEAEILG